MNKNNELPNQLIVIRSIKQTRHCVCSLRKFEEKQKQLCFSFTVLQDVRIIASLVVKAISSISIAIFSSAFSVSKTSFYLKRQTAVAACG